MRAGFLAAAAGILTAFMILAGAVAVLESIGRRSRLGLAVPAPVVPDGDDPGGRCVCRQSLGHLPGAAPASVRSGRRACRSSAGSCRSFPDRNAGYASRDAVFRAVPRNGRRLRAVTGTAEIFAIFAAVGTGLALPYLLVAAAPSLATRLPKPGPWMAVLRRLLGFALAGTAAWLVWVLAGQVGWPGALSVAALATGALVALHGALMPGRRRKVSALAALAFGLAAFVVPPTGPAKRGSGKKELGKPFQPGRILGLSPRDGSSSSTSPQTGALRARSTSASCWRASRSAQGWPTAR